MFLVGFPKSYSNFFPMGFFVIEENPIWDFLGFLSLKIQKIPKNPRKSQDGKSQVGNPTFNFRGKRDLVSFFASNGL